MTPILAALVLIISMLSGLAASAAPQSTITMTSRPDCSYCQKMKPILYRIQNEGNYSIVVVNRINRYNIV